MNGASLCSLTHSMFESPINIMLLYRQNQMRKEDFLYLIQHLKDQVDSVHIILGDFNIDYLKPDCEFLRNNLNNYEMIVEKATHVSGSLIDQIYIEKSLKDKYNVKSQVKPVYYSDHDAIIVNIVGKDSKFLTRILFIRIMRLKISQF